MPVVAVKIDLLTKAITYDEMVEQSGLTKRGVQMWVKRNRAHIYIEAYGPDKNGRSFVPQFRWSDVPKPEDAKRPGRVLTAAEQMRKYRMNRRKGTL